MPPLFVSPIKKITENDKRKYRTFQENITCEKD